MSIIARLKKILFPLKEQDPGPAYDLWAAGYDNQPGNLMLDLDETVFSELLDNITIKGKVIADIGCGTGRHWKKIYAHWPARLIGYDVSAGMLNKLQEKFPGAETFFLKDDLLPQLPDASCDIILSTLTLAHIPSVEIAMQEWQRVLKPGGQVLITDYHPEALAKGGKRTFKHEGKTVAVKNHIHSLEKIRGLAKQLGWKEIRFTERVIDDSVKGYYEKQNALLLFDSFINVPIIFGIHLNKADGTA
jgi:ubiquinone/menaquinone biosynthesis C-methylase UbiE